MIDLNMNSVADVSKNYRLHRKSNKNRNHSNEKKNRTKNHIKTVSRKKNLQYKTKMEMID